MNKFYCLICLAFFGVLTASCVNGLEQETDYGSPVTLTTKGDKPTDLEIFNLRLITDLEDPEYENADFLSCLATLIPGKRSGFRYDEIVILQIYLPNLDSLVKDQEVKPLRLLFGYMFSSNGNHYLRRMNSGRILYRGMRGDVALFEFQDVQFITDPITYSSNGVHVIQGTMECPVYNSINDR